MTPNEAKEVWDLFHSYWPAGSVMRYFSRRPRDGAVYGGSLGGPTELSRATDWADKHGYNSYWQPQPTKKRHGTRCNGADITHICYFMVDIDPTDEYEADPHGMAALVIDLMDGFVEAPLTHFTIYSGRGVQVFYPVVPTRLDSVFHLGDPRHEVLLRDAAPIAFGFWLKEMQRQLRGALGCIIDVECVDLPRLMRMPNTINQKTGAYSRFDNHSGNVATMGLLPALINRTPAVLWTPRNPVVSLGPKSHWIEYVPNMTVSGRRFLQEGSPSPGRHKAATSAMLSLIELGAEEEQVRGALYFGASMCEPPLPHAEVDDMVRRRFHTIAARQKYQNFDSLVDEGPDVVID